MPLPNLIGNPDAFPILRRWDFFNHAGVSPIPHAAAEAMCAFANQAESAAYLDAHWYDQLDPLRVVAAGLINAAPGEVAFIRNTSEGLATVAAGLSWRPQDRIVTTTVEYPANMYPWIDATQRFGLELVAVPERPSADGAMRVDMAEILREASHPRTRLVSLSHVEFASGQRLDLAAVGAFCRQRGILFCVDAIQSMGALPIDVRAMNIDFLSADGHKWMLGPEGAGIFFCRRELLDELHPLIVGWMNVVRAEDWGRYDYTLKPTAARFEAGSHNIAGLLGLKAWLEMLAEAGIPAVSQRIRALTDLLIEGLRAKGYQVLSPRTGDQWSGIVSFISPRHDLPTIWRSLRTEHRTEIALRLGRLRCSPHFYNTEEQIQRLVDHLPA